MSASQSVKLSASARGILDLLHRHYGISKQKLMERAVVMMKARYDKEGLSVLFDPLPKKKR